MFTNNPACAEVFRCLDIYQQSCMCSGVDMFRCISTILHAFREQRTPDNCLALLAVTMEDLYQVADESYLFGFRFVTSGKYSFKSSLVVI